jgi:hypothetical protein
VISHKLCWSVDRTAGTYATDGGFPFQMRALATLFDSTTLVVPCSPRGHRAGEEVLSGRDLSIAPLSNPAGEGFARKLMMLPWLARNAWRLVREVGRADAVHTPIPGDVGTIGMFLAMLFGKPLFVRHCGNWLAPKTTAERFWKWLMERTAGGRRVMLTTGGGAEPPSDTNAALQWIFSTSLTEDELRRCALRRDAPFGARLIIACRQDPEKGTGAVIRSLPRIIARFPDATLDVVGDGPALEGFKKEAQALGVAHRVTFHGKVSHDAVIRLFRSASVFCYPTAASEGFPKVVLEALACGLPVVTTRVSVLPDLLSTGGGALIEAVDSDSIADGVAACLGDAAEYARKSQRAIETASRYSLEHWTDTIGKHLEEAWGPLRREALPTRTAAGGSVARA